MITFRELQSILSIIFFDHSKSKKHSYNFTKLLNSISYSTMPNIYKHRLFDKLVNVTKIKHVMENQSFE